MLFILIVTCAEIAIVMCYFQLCSEDYHWWWRSAALSASRLLCNPSGAARRASNRTSEDRKRPLANRFEG